MARALLPDASTKDVALVADVRSAWFQQAAVGGALMRWGFRLIPGGVHLSKTMMLSELTALFDAALPSANASVGMLVLDGNVLGKRTGAARRLALARLNALYGVQTPNPIGTVLRKLWVRRREGRPLLALLCALAREPLLRGSADAVLPEPKGAAVRAPEFMAVLKHRYPARYSEKTLNSLARNCASSWTQAGHLAGKVAKRRSTPIVTPEAAAFAALLGSLAGFGGPALLASNWMRVLDRSEPELLNLLRAAEGVGLVRVRAAGGVVEINVRRTMAENLGAPEIVDS